MNSLTIDGIRDWAAERNISVTAERLLTLSYRSPTPTKRVTVLTEAERTPEDLLLLANRLVWVDSEDEEEVLPTEDRQYLFWIRENGIWSDMREALASDAFACLFKAHGLPPGTRGCLISETAPRIAVLLVLNAIIFGWDAYLTPLSARFLCHISHDGYIDLRTTDAALHRDLLERVKAWGAEERPVKEGVSP